MQLLAVLLLTALDIKFKARGYFYAGTATPGVLGRSGQVALIALPEEHADFEHYPGFKVMLVNGTKTRVSFETQDLRLNIVREARDAAGRWRPIDYLPNSWCGNSYFTADLPPGRHWTFVAPLFQGSFRTQMRFVLDQPGLHLVSNEFSGTINLEQFDKKQGHSPVSIMDPYDE
jgi:hypothetical protein